MLIYRVDMNYAQGVGTHVLPHVKPLGLSPGPAVHAALLPGSEKFQAEQPRLPQVPTLPKKPGALKVPKPQLSPSPTDLGRGTPWGAFKSTESYRNNVTNTYVTTPPN